ncbi:hypothetical protein EDF57_101909 [Novosphingobium sp. PhB55]|nr:hypothetical protein EDF57_101909 [Novosphingobium sp. PhB55]
MLRNLAPGEFIQGTIFTCALSDSYPNIAALGMLITARCDTAQDKAEVYNYIPLVPVESWIAKDGLEIVAKRAAANEMGSMKKAIADAGMDDVIIELISFDEILRELKKGTSKPEKSIAARFEKALTSYNLAKHIINQENRLLKSSLEYLSSNDGIYKSVIKELINNGIAEFHYIQKSYSGEETRGYVALMREIRFISSSLGKKIAIGLDVNEFDAEKDSYAPGLNHVRFSKDQDFAMPLSCISSPLIELVMQRFANLFSRIGVEDIPKEWIVEAHSWVKVMQEDTK